MLVEAMEGVLLASEDKLLLLLLLLLRSSAVVLPALPAQGVGWVKKEASAVVPDGILQ